MRRGRQQQQQPLLGAAGGAAAVPARKRRYVRRGGAGVGSGRGGGGGDDSTSDDCDGLGRGGGGGGGNRGSGNDEVGATTTTTTNIPAGWRHTSLPIDLETLDILKKYEERHCDPQQTDEFCFVCYNVMDDNYNTYYKNTDVDDVVKLMGTGQRTIALPTLCIMVHELFESTIRKKVNDTVKRERLRLFNSLDDKDVTETYRERLRFMPQWKPTIIKKHLEGHHNDAELGVEMTMKDIVHIRTFIKENCLVIVEEEEEEGGDECREDQGGANNDTRIPPAVPLPAQGTGPVRTRPLDDLVMDEPPRQRGGGDGAGDNTDEDTDDSLSISSSNPTTTKKRTRLTAGNYNGGNGSQSVRKVIKRQKIDPEQWRIYKECTELWLKLGKSGPEKMVPFYKEKRYVITDQTIGHPYINLHGKKIFNPAAGTTNTSAPSLSTVQQQ